MKNRNWFWGLVFLFGGILVVLSQVQSIVQIGTFTAIATVFLAAIVISSIVYRNFFGVIFPFVFLYELYEKTLQLPHIDFWILILSAALITSGLHIIFGSRFHKKHFHYHDKKKFETIEDDIDNNTPTASVNFGSSSKYLHSDNLKSGHFEVSFGELNVYFEQAHVCPEGADIDLTSSFGSLKIYVPRGWQVKDSIQATLGAVNSQSKPQVLDVNAPQLRLTGSVSFGAIEINYV
ncbi:MAG: hypothetical protein Q8876_01780 [Bacillota bacterium]|nr:hypothetical protein [Bacillota bacterium]